MNQICHLITTIERGGAENQLLILVEAQIKRGLAVTVIPLKGQLELKELFVNMGARVDTSLINLPFWKQAIIAKKMLKESNCIVHAHLPRSEIIAAFLGKHVIRTFSRHNAEPFWPSAPRIFSTLLSRMVSRKLKNGIAISNAVKQYCIDNGELSRRCDFFVVHYGFPFAKFEMMTKKSNFKKFDFGTVARLVPQKNLDVLLRAFKLLVAKNHELKLSIIGEGKSEAELIRLTAELGISSNVIWQGRQSDIPARMVEMGTFVLTSKYEGLGLVLLEAIAVKVPIIAANNTAIPEVLGEKYCGLFETGDYMELAAIMEQSLDRDFREQLLSEAVARKPLFQIETMESSIFAVYNRASER